MCPLLITKCLAEYLGHIGGAQGGVVGWMHVGGMDE